MGKKIISKESKMEKIWQGHLSGKVSRAAESFNASIFFDKKMYREDITGSIAHARMLGKCSIIPQEKAENIKRIFDNLEGDIKNKKLTYGLGAIIPSGIENLSLIANLNSIFRAPTTDETANISTAVTNATYYSIPNPSLKPEAGMSYEIGLRYDNNAIKAELIGFLGEYKDLIISKNTGRKASDGKAINQLQNARLNRQKNEAEL